MKTLSVNLFLLTKPSDAFPLGIPFLNSVPFCVVRGVAVSEGLILPSEVCITVIVLLRLEN